MAELMARVLSGVAMAALAFLLYRRFRDAPLAEGSAGPDLPPEGGKISAQRTRTFKKAKSLKSLGNESSGGSITVSPEELRIGGLAGRGTYPLESIEAVLVEPFGLSRVVIFHLRDDEKARAAWIRNRDLVPLLRYLHERGVPLDASAASLIEPP